MLCMFMLSVCDLGGAVRKLAGLYSYMGQEDKNVELDAASMRREINEKNMLWRRERVKVALRRERRDLVRTKRCVPWAGGKGMRLWSEPLSMPLPSVICLTTPPMIGSAQSGAGK